MIVSFAKKISVRRRHCERVRGLANLITVSKKRKDDAHLILEKVEEIEVHKILHQGTEH